MSKSGKHGSARDGVNSHTFTERVKKNRRKNKIAKKSRQKNR